MQRLIGAVWLLALVGLALAANQLWPLVVFHRPAGAAARSALAAATPFACPVTEPNGFLPPPGEHVFGRGPGGHGSQALWTNLWTWGERKVVVPPSHVNPDGSLGGMKWPWWRGVHGELEIEGRRLDDAAPPLHADIPTGYGERGFQVSGLIFPTAGCWEVTGRVGAARLSFVVLVVREDEATPGPWAGTPVAMVSTAGWETRTG